MRVPVLDDSLYEPAATPGAQWLRPSEWPPEADHLFRPRPFDTSEFPVISRFGDVVAVLLDTGHIWRRRVPLEVLPPEDRHCVIDASWMLDGEDHDRLWKTVRAINRGSSS